MDHFVFSPKMYGLTVSQSLEKHHSKTQSKKNIERSTRDMLDMTTVVLTPPRPARALSCHGCCCLVKFFVVNAGCIRRRYVRLNRA